MAGIRQTIVGLSTFAGSSQPKLPKVDPVNPSSVGALLLIDGNHPMGGFPAGAPTDNAVITNLFRASAATLLGVSASTLDVNQRVVNMTSTLGKVERTTKGGIHSIQSTTQTTNGQGYQAQIPTNIIAYMKANPTHSFYLSVWNMPTKLATNTPITDEFAIAAEASASGYAFAMGTVVPTGNGPTTANVSDAGRGTNNTPQCSVNQVAGLHSDFYGASNTVGRYGLFENGNFSVPNQISGRQGKRGARVFWRAYIEDLTVSGRSYATVLGLDQAEFAKQVNTAGGRYYGDTIVTDPSTYT